MAWADLFSINSFFFRKDFFKVDSKIYFKKLAKFEYKKNKLFIT